MLQLHADLLAELRRRKIVRSSNNPTGDYAELFFATAFGWELINNSSADADAADGEGHRYQIKSRRLTDFNMLVDPQGHKVAIGLAMLATNCAVQRLNNEESMR